MAQSQEQNLNTDKRFYDLKSIAIFRALHLGDMLCIIPAVRAIRHAYPEAEISLIGLPWQMDFVKRFHMYFDNFIEFPGWHELPEQKPDSKKILQFLQEMRRKKFDLVLQMQGNGDITNEMCRLWNPKKLVGLSSSHGKLHDELFPISEDTDHEILRFMKLINVLQLPAKGNHLEFPFFEQEIASSSRITKLLDLENKPYVCIHPGARDPKRRWAPEYFAYVANVLHSHGYQIVLTGSKEESEILHRLQDYADTLFINIIDILGEVDLGTLALILKESKLLVCNDTGVSHIASALQIPSVVIFSNYSTIERWAPLNRERHRVITPEKSDDPELVLFEVLDHLKKFSGKPLLFHNV